MYIRQLSFSIIPGSEERAVALCSRYAARLRAFGIPARIAIVRQGAFTLQLCEEYVSLEDLESKRRFLDRNDMYHNELSTWARDFYPLVQAASPVLIVHEHEVGSLGA